MRSPVGNAPWRARGAARAMGTTAVSRPLSVRPSVSTAEEPTGHRDMEAGTGELTGRRDPSERNRPLDERVPRSMSWRPSPVWNIANKLSREPEPI